MSTSILTSTKLNLGLAADYTAFDPQITMFINAVFSDLQQLGVGPEDGYYIEDDTPTWDAFLGDDPTLNNVKTYIFLRVKMLFDPPDRSYVIDAMKNQIEQLEWRMNVRREDAEWVDPNGPNEMEDGELVLDGGIP